MIDLWGELHNFSRIDVESLSRDGKVLPDNIKNSYILYNKALDSLKLDSEDIAIIELKKAISMNPNFYEAMNLLGLCYLYSKDNAKAAEMFQRVIAAGKDSINALKYLNMLDSGDVSPQMAPKGRKKKAPKSENIKEGSTGKELSLIGATRIASRQDVLKYLIGFAAGALLIFGLSFIKAPSSDNGENMDSLANAVKQANEEAEMYKSNYKKLEEEHKNLQKTLDTANSTVNYYKSVIKLYEAESLYYKKEYESAADMLILLKAVEFNGEDKEKYDKLYAEVMPLAARTVYEEGVVLANTGKNFEEALKKLKKVDLYQDTFEKMDAALYYLGKCYQNLNDSRNAIATYQRLIEQYPKSRYVYWAKIRISELTEIP